MFKPSFFQNGFFFFTVKYGFVRHFCLNFIRKQQNMEVSKEELIAICKIEETGDRAFFKAKMNHIVIILNMKNRPSIINWSVFYPLNLFFSNVSFYSWRFICIKFIKYPFWVTIYYCHGTVLFV